MDDLRLHGLIGGGTKLTGDNIAIASSASGTTLKLTPPKGCFDGIEGNNVTITDADFIEANIKKDVNLFGKVGTLAKKFANGTLTGLTIQGTNNPPNYYDYVVTGLDFTPNVIILNNGTENGFRTYDFVLSKTLTVGSVTMAVTSRTAGGFTVRATNNQPGATFNSGSTWYACE